MQIFGPSWQKVLPIAFLCRIRLRRYYRYVHKPDLGSLEYDPDNGRRQKAGIYIETEWVDGLEEDKMGRRPGWSRIG